MANVLLVKGALKVGTSKTGRKVIGAILAFFLTIFVLIICVFSSIISIFTNSGRITSNFNAQNTEVYRELREIYDEYVVTKKNELSNLARECWEEHSYPYYVNEYNPETQEMERVEYWACNEQISWHYSYIASAYALAYLSVKNHRTYLSDRANIRIDEDEVIEFWDDITEIQREEDLTEDGITTIHFYNSIMTPEEIAEEFFWLNYSKKQFLESVHIVSQFVGVENFEESFYASENAMGIPLYYQYEQPWGSVPYGSRTISTSGCGPTCIAMVFTYLKGYIITPSDVVDYTQNRYYVAGAGSSWEIFGACATHWDITCTNVGLNQNKIVESLEDGKPVILSMGPGTFTSSGHFIVLTGITEDGKVTVNDPNDNGTKRHYEKLFSISQILREAKGGWSFE